MSKTQSIIIFGIICTCVCCSFLITNVDAFNRPLSAFISNGFSVQPFTNGSIAINTISPLTISSSTGSDIQFSLQSYKFISTPVHVFWTNSGFNYFDETMNINGVQFRDVQHMQDKTGVINTIALTTTDNHLVSPITVLLLQNGNPTGITFNIQPGSVQTIMPVNYAINSGNSYEWLFTSNTNSPESYSFNAQVTITYNY